MCHKGNIILLQSANLGIKLNTMQAWQMSKRGRDSEDWMNPHFGPKMLKYTETGKATYGEGFEPNQQDIDPQLVVPAGHGKPSGRHLIGNMILDTASTPSLSEYKAHMTSSSASVLPRSNTLTALSEIKVLFLLVHQFMPFPCLHCKVDEIAMTTCSAS